MLDLSYWFNLIGFRRAVFEDAYLKVVPHTPTNSPETLKSLHIRAFILELSRITTDDSGEFEPPELLQCKFIQELLRWGFL